MNILLTGATGFIGSHLAIRLAENNDIFIIKRKKSDLWRIKEIVNKIRIYDVEDELENAFKDNKIDVVIHLAAKYIKKEKNSIDISSMAEANIVFPTALLNLAVKYKVKSFINTGSCFEYQLSDEKITETQPKRPYNFYAATKLAFEELFKYFVLNKKINGITLKLFYPYGEKDNKKVINLIVDSILKGNPLSLSKGGQRLNFTYVADIVDAYIKALEFINSKKYKQYTAINIGSENTHSLKEAVEKTEAITNKNSKIKFESPVEENEIMYMGCKSVAAKEKLDWQAKTSLEAGLKKLISFESSQSQENKKP